MSFDVGIENDLPTSTEQQSNDFTQQANFSIGTINTVENANETNLGEEHSAAVTKIKRLIWLML